MHFKFKKILLYIVFSILSLSSISAQDTIVIVDKKPRFPGGERALAIYWERQMRTRPVPYQKIPQGEGVVAFTIDERGAVQDVFIKKSLTPELDGKALTAARNMPRWEPAERGGRPVAMPMTMSFFVLPKDDMGNWMIDPVEAHKVVPERGFTFSLWAGSTFSTGDYAQYLRPARFVMGLQAGYTLKNVSIGFEYDIFNVSKVRQPFTVDGNLFTPDRHRFSSINLFLPLAVRLKVNDHWHLWPYFSPVLNNANINVRGDSNEDPFNYSWWSFGGGVYVDRLVDRSAAINPRDKKRIIDSYFRTRLFVTPMHFRRDNSTGMQGTVISLSVGIHGLFRGE